MLDATVYEVLWTPSLVQKRKKWFDGQCKFSISRNKMRLTDAEGRLLSEQFWSSRDGFPDPGTTVYFERYIVELDSILRTIEENVSAQKVVPPKLSPKPLRSVPVRSFKEPSLDEVLKRNPVRVLRPATMLSKPSTSTTVPRKRKYAPWGDQTSSDVTYMETTFIDDPVAGTTHNQPENAHTESPQELPSSFTAPHDTVKTDPAEPDSASEGLGRNEGQPDANDTDDDDDDKLFVSPYPLQQTQEETEPTNIVLPEIFSVDSDLESESELEIVHAGEAAPLRSLFADTPDHIPAEGPWSKEAYLLFSWHPPTTKHVNNIKHEIV